MQTDPNIRFEANLLDDPAVGDAGPISKETVPNESAKEDIPAPRLRNNQQRGVDARKRKPLDIPMV